MLCFPYLAQELQPRRLLHFDMCPWKAYSQTDDKAQGNLNWYICCVYWPHTQHIPGVVDVGAPKHA